MKKDRIGGGYCHTEIVFLDGVTNQQERLIREEVRNHPLWRSEEILF